MRLNIGDPFDTFRNGSSGNDGRVLSEGVAGGHHADDGEDCKDFCFHLFAFYVLIIQETVKVIRFEPLRCEVFTQPAYQVKKDTYDSEDAQQGK
ncbi:MAG: hypothetical protein IJ524_02085 [Bacteroidales bacterium]|nr:hypothetical protein [Bacteroidales bacterium]